MELPFEKTVCRYWKQTLYTLLTREETQELRLPESMPDLGRIISSWGQVILRGKDWRGGGVGLNGGVMVWVLYAPEDGGALQRLESWIPFQIKTDIPDPESEAVIRVEPFLQGVDARIASSRKLILRAGVGLLTQVLTPDSLELYHPGELPEDLELKLETYPFGLTREAGEKSYMVEEKRTLPAGMPPAEQLVYYRLMPQILEQKVLGSKAAFRGMGDLHVLYLDPDGRLSAADLQIPFAQYIDLEGEYEDGAEISCIPCVTGLELEIGEDGSLDLRCGMVAQYTVRSSESMELLEDCYSPCREVELEKQICPIPTWTDHGEKGVDLTGTLNSDSGSWVDLIFSQKAPGMARRTGAAEVEIGGTFHGLTRDAGGQYTAAQAQDSKTIPVETNCDTVCFTTGQGSVSCRPEADSWRTDTKLALHLGTLCQKPVEMVTGIRVGEEKAPDPDRPSVIIRRRGEKESLWELAKRCGSTVGAIRRMNHLEGEPEGETLLLIPVI